jgi:spore coat protein A, manganese oxidase
VVATGDRQKYGVEQCVGDTLGPVRGDAITECYEIMQRSAKAEILPGYTTEIWGYNGTFPGPTIQARAARRLAVRYHLQLGAATERIAGILAAQRRRQ